MLRLGLSVTSATDSFKDRSLAPTTAPLPLISMHSSSSKNHPKTAVLVFGAPFFVLFWRSKKEQKSKKRKGQNVVKFHQGR